MTPPRAEKTAEEPNRFEKLNALIEAKKAKIAKKIAKRLGLGLKEVGTYFPKPLKQHKTAPGATNTIQTYGTTKNQAKVKIERSEAKRKKRKAKRKALGKKKSRKRSLVEKDCWDAFAKFIRERDREKGCFSCGGKVEAAGHLISRRKRATKYHEENVLGQCHLCNYKDKTVKGYHDICVAEFIKKFGPDKYQELVEMSKTTIQHTKSKLQEMTNIYVNKRIDKQTEILTGLPEKIAPSTLEASVDVPKP